MGMNLVAFWLSWFVTCFLFIIPTILVFTLVLKLDFKGDGALFQYSDPSVIVVLLLCYSMCVVSFAMAISCAVNKGEKSLDLGGSHKAGLLYTKPMCPMHSDFLRYELHRGE